RCDSTAFDSGSALATGNSTLDRLIGANYRAPDMELVREEFRTIADEIANVTHELDALYQLFARVCEARSDNQCGSNSPVAEKPAEQCGVTPCLPVTEPIAEPVTEPVT